MEPSKKKIFSFSGPARGTRGLDVLTFQNEDNIGVAFRSAEKKPQVKVEEHATGRAARGKSGAAPRAGFACFNGIGEEKRTADGSSLEIRGIGPYLLLGSQREEGVAKEGERGAPLEGYEKLQNWQGRQ